MLQDNMRQVLSRLRLEPGYVYITCLIHASELTTETDIFLPSYMDYESDLEHRPDPVQEIVLTDEEAAAIFPQ